MGDKQFIVGETLMDYYQIKCEKKDYSRVLAPNTVARLLNKQQTTIEQKDKQLQKAKEYFMDYLSREMSADNFSEMWDLVIGV